MDGPGVHKPVSGGVRKTVSVVRKLRWTAGGRGGKAMLVVAAVELSSPVVFAVVAGSGSLVAWCRETSRTPLVRVSMPLTADCWPSASKISSHLTCVGCVICGYQRRLVCGSYTPAILARRWAVRDELKAL